MCKYKICENLPSESVHVCACYKQETYLNLVYVDVCIKRRGPWTGCA